MRRLYIEIDIEVTKDIKIILLHDPDLERTTNGSGWIRDKTLKEIKELRLKNHEGKISSESLPALDEVMEIMRKQSINLQIDVKYYDSDIIVEELLQRINNNDIEKTIITSNKPQISKKSSKIR